MIEDKLVSLGYQKIGRAEWNNGKKVVHVVHSSEFDREYIRIMWREEWKAHNAIIYDYSKVRRPVCIVPLPDLLSSDFVKEKRRRISYANSGYWWSQRFPTNHELVKLILSFKDRWDLI